MLLGLGWNFLFVGASTLLTDTHIAEERAKTQGLNDFIVFTTVAAASLSAGALQHSLGWQWVNIAAIPAVIVVFLPLLWLKYLVPGLCPCNPHAMRIHRKGWAHISPQQSPAATLGWYTTFS